MSPLLSRTKTHAEPSRRNLIELYVKETVRFAAMIAAAETHMKSVTTPLKSLPGINMGSTRGVTLLVERN